LWFKFLLGEKMLSNQRIAFGMTIDSFECEISIPSIRFGERGFLELFEAHLKQEGRLCCGSSLFLGRRCFQNSLPLR
jgi:hypothetical protein